MLISNQSDWIEMRRQVGFNSYSIFPRRVTMMDMVENMMMRVTKPMKITTAIHQKGDV